MMTLQGYLRMAELEFLPCPRCGSPDIEWSSVRDRSILTQYVHCNGCGLSTFHVDTAAFTLLANLDYESSVTKYNAWVKTNPKEYDDDTWENCK